MNEETSKILNDFMYAIKDARWPVRYERSTQILYTKLPAWCADPGADRDLFLETETPVHPSMMESDIDPKAIAFRGMADLFLLRHHSRVQMDKYGWDRFSTAYSAGAVATTLFTSLDGWSKEFEAPTLTGSRMKALTYVLKEDGPKLLLAKA